jgi:hypothetical protein
VSASGLQEETAGKRLGVRGRQLCSVNREETAGELLRVRLYRPGGRKERENERGKT